MSNLTPGPWYYHKSVNAHDQGLIISETTGANVAVVYNEEADTALLAAAPDLLKALSDIVEVIYNDPRLLNLIGRERFNAAREATAKAEGN